MPESRTCQLPKSTGLFCIDINPIGQAEPLQCHGTAIVISSISELGGRRW